MRGLQRVALLLLLLALAGCAGLARGFDPAGKRLPDAEYHWARELYEMPLGLVGTPLLLVMLPLDLIDNWRRAGFRLGHNSSLWLVFLDPRHNVRWSALPDPD